jgi:hypothetical protein|tara:strand:- start:744 stop:947 length:204 start_codon:yes stop_codon:yes gene_type:complete
MPNDNIPDGEITMTVEFKNDGDILLTARDSLNDETLVFRKEPNMALHNMVMDMLRKMGVQLLERNND